MRESLHNHHVITVNSVTIATQTSQRLKRHAGVTLFEVLLVLVLGAAILYLSIQQYRIYRLDADVQQVKYNVDTLFLAATKFYQGNCSNQTNPVTSVKIPNSGVLDPSNSPVSPYLATVTQLQNGGYLAVGPEGLGVPPFPASPIVDSTGVNNGYQIQYNLTTTSNRTMNTYPSGTPVNTGKLIVWTIQISVQLLHSATATQYMNLLGADCVSTATAPGGSVTPCVAGGALPVGTPLFLVWQRLPSMSSSVPSPLWIMDPTAAQFNQMYTTDPITYLLETALSQNYLCGS